MCLCANFLTFSPLGAVRRVSVAYALYAKLPTLAGPLSTYTVIAAATAPLHGFGWMSRSSSPVFMPIIALNAGRATDHRP